MEKNKIKDKLCIISIIIVVLLLCGGSYYFGVGNRKVEKCTNINIVNNENEIDNKDSNNSVNAQVDYLSTLYDGTIVVKNYEMINNDGKYIDYNVTLKNGILSVKEGTKEISLNTKDVVSVTFSNEGPGTGTIIVMLDTNGVAYTYNLSEFKNDVKDVKKVMDNVMSFVYFGSIPAKNTGGCNGVMARTTNEEYKVIVKSCA